MLSKQDKRAHRRLPCKVFDLTLPLDLVAEGYRAMDERRAVKNTAPPVNSSSHATTAVRYALGCSTAAVQALRGRRAETSQHAGAEPALAGGQA
jgi:hypothetical protein